MGPLGSQRDKSLGIAAFVFSARYLLVTLNVASSLSWSYSFANPRLTAASLLMLLGGLLRAAGFVLVAIGFLAGGSARAKRIKSGAWVIACGYLGVFAAASLSTVRALSDPEFPLPGWTSGRLVMQSLSSLAVTVAFVLVASAFAPKDRGETIREAHARNQRLGWASVGLGVGFGLLVASDLLADFEMSALAADALLLVAAVVAARGFFVAAGADQYPAIGPLARREGFLAIAAIALALSGALAVLREIILPLGLTLSYADWRSAALGWTNVLGSLCLMVAGLSAARGFALSRRSLLGRD
jgi:hypothetical protein